MNNRGFWVLVLLLVCTNASTALAFEFDHFFMDKTMRVDLFHTGSKEADLYSLDEVREEGPWAGSRTKLLDDRNLGMYFFFLFHQKSNRLIFSRGYSTIFGEWRTTKEAADGVYGTFSETLLFPYPKEKVRLVVKGRDKQGKFQSFFETIIDPDSRFINREKRGRGGEVVSLFVHGPSAPKVDILVIGDGYTATERGKFLEDGGRLMGVLFRTSPFLDRKEEFNVRLLFSPSMESGPDEPRKGVFRHTAFGTSFNSLDLPRYMLTKENKAIRNMTSIAPCDALIIISNAKRYGGGGIFNLYASSTSDNEWSDYVVVHEFGHSFGGLADEYYSSAVAYEEFYPRGVEPWEPNISALLPGKPLKWAAQIKKGTPVPTPWGKEEYEGLAKKAQKREMAEHLKSQKYAGTVGCFEGAGYLSKGMYRPCIDCVMFTKRRNGFCPVCRMAIERSIDFHTVAED